MQHVQLEEMTTREIAPGFLARFVHSENMTFAYWDILDGAELPGHHHPHEQVVNVLEGAFELTVDGDTRLLGPGSVVVIPPEAVHSGKARSDSRIIDVFCPVREDYR